MPWKILYICFEGFNNLKQIIYFLFQFMYFEYLPVLKITCKYAQAGKDTLERELNVLYNIL